MKRKIEHITVTTLTLTVLLIGGIFISQKPVPISNIKEVKGTVALYPEIAADAFIAEQYPNNNYGAGAGNGFHASYGDGDPVSHQRSYLKFNVGTIPSGATVNSALLKIYQFNCWEYSAPNTRAISVAQVNGSWTELGLTWNNKPTSSFISSTVLDCSLGWKTFDVKNAVTNWKNGQPNYGLSVYGAKNGEWFRYFSSRESGNSQVPKLEISYTTSDTAPPSSGSNPADPGSAPAPGISSTPEASNSTNQPALPVDSSITAPKLYKILGGGKELTLENGEIDAYLYKRISVIGSGTPGDSIIAFVNGGAYSATVNSLGYWAVTFNIENFKEGTYAVTAQAQRDGKGSDIAVLFNLKKTDYEKLARELSKNSEDTPWYMMGFVSPIVSLIIKTLLFVGFVVLIIVIILIHHARKKKKTKLATQAEQSPPLVQAPAEPAPPAATEPALTSEKAGKISQKPQVDTVKRTVKKKIKK